MYVSLDNENCVSENVHSPIKMNVVSVLIAKLSRVKFKLNLIC